MQKQYLTEKEVSESTGISRSTLQHYRWKGLGPKFKKIGTKVLYSVKDLEEFFDSHPTVQSTSQYQIPQEKEIKVVVK